MSALVTKQSLQTMLSNPNRVYVERVIGRALVALLNRQTHSEQATNATHVHNNVGFTGADAHSGSLTAKYFMKHGSLQDWMVQKWTKADKHGFARLAKYHSQLNEIAQQKRA